MQQKERLKLQLERSILKQLDELIVLGHRDL
jgi:hypothetical protein